MGLQYAALPLKGLMRISTTRNADARGFLSRIFCAKALAEAGWNVPIAQINHTLTAQAGTVRGMHYQNPPHAELKLVSCLRGKVWDVAVDLRAHSPTFLHWHAETLSPENGNALLLPRGFAHGFQALTDNCELLYLHSAAYAPEAEAGLRFDDPGLAIHWPLPVAQLSARDQAHPVLNGGFKGVGAE